MKICVVGLGYIGLPTAAILASKGHQVTGMDVKPHVLDNIREHGASPEEPGLAELVMGELKSGNLALSDKPVPADVFIICLPTPILADKKADISYVEKGASSIIPHLQKGNMIILESTVPPRTTSDMVGGMVREAGFDPENDLDLAFAPERVIPGDIIRELTTLDRVIGGLTPQAARRAKELYSCFVTGEIVTTDSTTAEFVKLVENSYRDVNIAFANELAQLSYDFGIDVREAIEIANRHPRVNILQPGPGVGGHCIAVDPYFIIQGAPDTSRMLALARVVNSEMPGLVVDVFESLMGNLDGRNIAILGLAYKPNVGDCRESPSMEVIRILESRGANCRAHDPYVKDSGIELISLEDAVKNADGIIITTGHHDFRDIDPARILELARGNVMLDTHRVLDRGSWEKAGWNFCYLGDGKASRNNDL